MKKYISIVLSVLLIVAYIPIAALAEDSTNTVNNENEQSTQSGDDSRNVEGTQNTDNSQDQQDEEGESEVKLESNEFCVSLDKLLESVDIKLEVQEDGKNVLTINFANEKLEDSQIVTKEDISLLAEKVLEFYLASIGKKYTKDTNKEENGISFNVEEIKNDKEDIVDFKISISTIHTLDEITADFEKEIKPVIKKEVTKTLADNSLEKAKALFEESRIQVKEMQRELIRIRKSKDSSLLKEASENLYKARQLRSRLEDLKDGLDAYKDQIKDLIDEEDEENKDNDNDKDKDEDEDSEKDEENNDNDEDDDITDEINDEDEDDKDKELKELEKRKEKAERIRELIKTRSQKRQQIIEKLENQSSGKAPEKIEENTAKQLKKHQDKLDKLTNGEEDTADEEDEDEDTDTGIDEDEEEEEDTNEENTADEEVEEEEEE